MDEVLRSLTWPSPCAIAHTGQLCLALSSLQPHASPAASNSPAGRPVAATASGQVASPLHNGAQSLLLCRLVPAIHTPNTTDHPQDTAPLCPSRVRPASLPQQSRARRLDAASCLQVLPPHNHLVQFHGACMEEVPPMLVMEFLAGGDLRGALSNSQLAPSLTWYRCGLTGHYCRAACCTVQAAGS